MSLVANAFRGIMMLRKKPIRSLPLLIPAILLTGCTQGPDFLRPSPPAVSGYLPPGEQSPVAVEERLPADWWTLFHSSDLDRVVRDAISGNPTLVAAQASLEQAAALAVAAGGALAPQLDLTAQADRMRINLASYGMSGPSPVFNLYQVGPSISYALDIFGRNRRQAEQAGALADVQAYQAEAAYLTLTGGVVMQAVTIASLRAQIRLAEDIVAADTDNLGLVRTAKAAGWVGNTDILRAESQLASDRAVLPPLLQQLAAARHKMAVLAGHLPAEWQPPEFDLAAFSVPQPPLSLPSSLTGRRPDILAAEAELHAASAAVGVAAAQRLPDITLSANLLQQAIFPGYLWQEAASSITAGGGLTAPLFHGDALAAHEDAAHAGLRAAEARYKQTVQEAFRQVADTLQALVHDGEETVAREKAVAAAEQSLELTRLSYAAGQVTLLDVLDAQRQTQQSRLGLASARAQHLHDSAQLFLAMGGGWWERPGRTGSL